MVTEGLMVGFVVIGIAITSVELRHQAVGMKIHVEAATEMHN